MALILICGEKANILERIASAPVASPAAASGFPATNLYAPAVSSSIFLFGSIAANPNVIFDLQDVLNGGFESALSSADWSDVSVGASNTFTRVTSTPSPQVGSGSGKANLTTTGGSNFAGGRQTRYRRAGEKRTLSAGIITDNASRTGRIEIFNPITSKYLTSGGAWQAGQVDCMTRANVAWGTQTLTYTVESQAVCNRDLVPLQIRCYCSGSGAGWAAFDEVYDWPWNDLVTVHGWLNLEPGSPLEIHSSTNNFGGNDTTRATPAMPDNLPMNPALFATFTQQGDRWLQVKLAGTPSGLPYNPYGGMVGIWQQVLPARGHDYGWGTDWAWAQARSSVRSYRLEDAATRAVALAFKYPSSATFAEARDVLFGRSALGHFPLLVVPSDTEDLVVFGKIEPSWSIQRELNSQWNAGAVKVLELPHPTITNA